MSRSPLIASASVLVLGLAVYAVSPSQTPAHAGAPPVVNSRLATDRPTTVPQNMAQVQMTFAPIVKRVAPAVVNVYTRSVVQQPVNPFFNDPFFRQFFGGGGALSRQRVQQSLGSGVIVRSDGTILTNNRRSCLPIRAPISRC